MRLTLRTLLAYLDDVLAPNEAREIGQKIAQSREAEALVEQIRESLRRRRIAAPELAGPGSGPDPNIVSEYLENLLPPNQVVEYEKLCRSSDLHLAEVAACHKILTMVMGQPLDVSDETRERMYALGTRKVSAPDLTSGTPPKMATGMGTPETVPNAQGLPDYLTTRRSHGRTWTVLAVLLTAGVWLGLVLSDQSIWSDRNQQQLTDAESQADSPHNGAEADASQDASSVTDKPDSTTAKDRNDTLAARGTSQPSSRENGRLSINPPPPDESAVGPLVPPVIDPSLAATPDGRGQMPPQADRADASPTTVPPAGDAVAVVPAPEIPAVPPGNLEAPPADTRPDPARPAPLPVEPTLPPVPENAVAWSIVQPDAIDLYREMESRAWVTTRGGAFAVLDEFVAPQPFTGRLRINDHLQLDLQPGTRMQRLPGSLEARHRLLLNRGRLLIKREIGLEEPIRLGLVIGDREWQLELADQRSVIAVEVQLPIPQGRPQVAPRYPLQGGIGIVSGEALLSTAGIEPISLTEASGWLDWSAVRQRPLIEQGSPLPNWTRPEETVITTARRQLLKQYEREFTTDVLMSIGPVVSDRRAAIAELAVRTLTLIDHYLEVVPALTSEHEEVRAAAALALRQWLAMKPDHELLIQEELNRRMRAEVADLIVKLLWGISRTDAQTAEVSSELVELLGHEELAVRDLAIGQIMFWTGRNLGYHPQATPVERRSAINRWQDYLARESTLIKSD